MPRQLPRNFQMPEKIPFRFGKEAKYPYDEWFVEGDGFVLVRGEDFTCQAGGMIGSLHKMAARRGLIVEIGHNGSPGTKPTEIYLRVIRKMSPKEVEAHRLTEQDRLAKQRKNKQEKERLAKLEMEAAE
jgi:hypothetical protein